MTPKFYDEDAPKPSPKWMVIFADLLALMITFFVLIYSMSVIDETEWKDIRKSLQQRLNPLKQNEEEIVVVPETKAIPKIVKPIGDDVNYLYLVLKKKLAANNINYVRLSELGDNVMLDMESRQLFGQGIATISEDGRKKLDMIASLIVPLSNRMEIHALVPPPNVQDPLLAQLSQIDRWNVSSARARSVATHFEEVGYQHNIISIGRADSLYTTLPDALKPQPSRIHIIVSKHALSRSKMEAGAYP